ncbi:MAG: DUF4338 domain-containing protein [Actinomycetota bacterium]|nr:DUF4338 domain-containing protein [Actinomycetota bacterium]
MLTRFCYTVAMVSSWRASLLVRPVAAGELERFNAELSAHHWLGHRLSGRSLRYVATIDDEWVAVLGFGSAALGCAAREGLLGWDRELRLRRLGLITGNQRFCVLPAGRRPHLASAVLGACLRRLPADHLTVWGRPVLAVETFTDPARHAGSCYAAAGFTPVGRSAGYARNRGAKVRHGRPKMYWLRPLHRHSLTALTAAFDSPLTHPPHDRALVDMNTLDIDGPAGLLAVLGQVPEHRKARGIRHQLPALLAVATAAVLSGADSTAAIAQYARTLTQPALAALGIRRNKRTATLVAPAYQTLRRAIRSVDAHTLDTAVTGWLHAQVSAERLCTGQLTRLVIALDGKTVRGAKDTDGNQLHLFAALVHGEATVIAQHRVDTKSNEISEFIPLLDQIAERHHSPDQHHHDTHNDDTSDNDQNTQTTNHTCVTLVRSLSPPLAAHPPWIARPARPALARSSPPQEAARDPTHAHGTEAALADVAPLGKRRPARCRAEPSIDLQGRRLTVVNVRRCRVARCVPNLCRAYGGRAVTSSV